MLPSLASFLLFVSPIVIADNYAVLVAGSKGYSNYRHQADVCHAYQILKRNGIPEDNIITMAYDDIAHAFRNPYKGKLFNKPTEKGTPGVDVYAGCKIDYKKGDVNPKTFLAVLKGDASAVKGKVLNTTANDRVFINFADHGAPGLIAFPHGELHADDLNEALQYMHDHNMYKELVFYLEACESGSMFDGRLPSNISIFATTAANGQESSWGTYCPPSSKVDGKNLHSCLGDLYSVNWMEDADKGDNTESLEKQYEIVKNLTTRSHVSQFGETDFDTEPADHFWGRIAAPASHPSEASSPDIKTVSSIDSRDANLASLYSLYLGSNTKNLTERGLLAQELIDEIKFRQWADKLFHRIAEDVMSENNGMLSEALYGHRAPTLFACHRQAIAEYKNACADGELADYALKHVRILVNLCEITKDTERIVKSIQSAC